MLKILDLVGQVAASRATILITGETGTGKELIANAIHAYSVRAEHPFVPVHSGSVPPDLLESALFGHVKGAFTGAVASRKGYFETVNGGTIFLDEIGELPLGTQARLLRVLETGEYIRVGSSKVQKTDVRVIAATNKELLESTQTGKFREDLYYRLLGMPIQMPALRERGNDIILIAKHFIDQFCNDNNLQKKYLDVEAKKKLMFYSFPGNIRELKSVVELACVMSDSEEIKAEHIQTNGQSNNVLQTDSLTLKQYTTKLIQHYLDVNNYDVLKVAQLLDIGKSTIYRMVSNNELKLYKNSDAAIDEQ